jgi:hypothetical protein
MTELTIEQIEECEFRLVDAIFKASSPGAKAKAEDLLAKLRTMKTTLLARLPDILRLCRVAGFQPLEGQ